MLTSGSVEVFINNEMKRLGMAALFLGELCQLRGIPASQTRLSAALRGDRPLSNEVGQQVRKLVEEIAAYADGLSVPVALTDPTQIKSILDERAAVNKELTEITPAGTAENANATS